MKYSFFFHYNKPATKKAGKPVVSLHYKNQCILIENLICNVPIQSRVRERQPRLVMVGKSDNVIIKDKVGYIN